MTNAWIEAMRLRTLPVSIAGVLTAISYNISDDTFCWLPALLCMLVAVSAQIASNFANEYYDFKKGLDKVGRDGPRRGVTEGDITPSAMLTATFVTLGIACLFGCALLLFSDFWLVFVGIFIALGVLAYSTGPYPLSHHGLGEVAVIVFYGLIPVNFTYYVQAGQFTPEVFLASLAVGLMGANVLIVNNYRDIDDDRLVNKRTLAVMLGRKAMVCVYVFNVMASVALLWWSLPKLELVTLTLCLVLGIADTTLLCRLKGAKLTKVLALTSMTMLIVSLSMLGYAIL